MTNSFPANPIAAVTHADPYPYYANLVAETPLYRDESLGIWVATSAAAVTAVLTQAPCRVRPIDEPVPKTLLGSPAAEIFRHLIRMNDGTGHCPLNRAVASTLASVPAALMQTRSQEWAMRLFAKLEPIRNLSRVNEFAFQLSTHVLGSFLGVPDARLDEVSRWIGDFVRCVFPSSTPEQLERGKIAAGKLLELFANIVAASQRANEDTLLIRLAREADRLGRVDSNV